MLLIGIGATVLMDSWSIVRKHLFGVPLPNYALVGRWIAHMTRGQFRHNAIAASSPMGNEHAIGWTAHYLIGIAFAAVLIGIWGDSWIQHPTIGPALAVGIATVIAPFLLMQPGMGSGIAASSISDGSNRSSLGASNRWKSDCLNRWRTLAKTPLHLLDLLGVLVIF
jgi:hypothetical protein